MSANNHYILVLMATILVLAILFVAIYYILRYVNQSSIFPILIAILVLILYIAIITIMSTSFEGIPFKPFKTSNPDTILVEMAALAYSGSVSDIQDGLEVLNDFVYVDSIGDTTSTPYAFVAMNTKKEYVISIRGTKLNFSDVESDLAGNNLQDISEKLTPSYTNIEGAKAGSGFINDVTKLVNNSPEGSFTQTTFFGEKPEKLYIIGHSLGGAITYSFAVYLLQEIQVTYPIEIISYASPTPGNLAFADIINGKNTVSHTRYFIQHDIIPSFYNNHHTFAINMFPPPSSRPDILIKEAILNISENAESVHVSNGTELPSCVLLTLPYKIEGTTDGKFYPIQADYQHGISHYIDAINGDDITCTSR